MPDQAETIRTLQALVRRQRRDHRDLQEWFALVVLAAGGSITVTSLMAVQFEPRRHVIVRDEKHFGRETVFTVRPRTPLDR